MKKLSKTRINAIEELADELADATKALEAAQLTFNHAITAYNELLQRAEELAVEIGQEIEDYVSERSDKWQESDAASAYADWQSAWGELDFSSIEEVELPMAVDEHETMLRDAPREVDL